MTWCVGGWGPLACSHPLPRWGLEQALGSPVQEVRRWELEALWVELEEEQSWTQEQHRCSTAKTQELKASLEREQQLLAEQLQSQWGQQQAQEVWQRRQPGQWQRVAETRQLLRRELAELREGQELLWQDCPVAVHQM